MFASKVNQTLCSVLSSVQRLPPFDFTTHNGYNYLRIRTNNDISYIKDKNISIIPLNDQRIQMILVPQSNVTDIQNSLSENVCSLLKDLDEKQIEKYSTILMPAFSVGLKSEELDEKLTTL